jgi:hypothetical protein
MCGAYTLAASGHGRPVTAEGPPVYAVKTVIPIAGALVMLQGAAEIIRCIVAIRTGTWPARLEDVEEIDVIDRRLAHRAVEGAHAVDDHARHRSAVEHKNA